MTEKRYRVDVEKRAIKAMKRFPEEVRFRIREAMADLASNPRPRGCKKLHTGVWRIWVGRSYRIYYGIDDRERVVRVVEVASKEAAD